MTQVQDVFTTDTPESQPAAISFPQLTLVSSVDSTPQQKALGVPASPLPSVTAPSDHSTHSFETLTAKQAVSRYVATLKDESWCIDTSGAQLKAFHALSSRFASVEHLRARFSDWANENNVRVKGKFSEFLSSLDKRLVAALPRVLGTAFRPVPERFFDTHNGVTLANTYVPFKPERQPCLPVPPIFSEYLARIFMSREDERTVLDWCADIIQNPTRRPEWGVIMSGDHGTGKSTIVTLVRKALGQNHVWQQGQYEPALQRFSQVFPDNLLVCFDDAPPTKNVYESLKYNVSAKTQSIEIKAVQNLVQREVYSRILICTNRDTPFDFEGEEDRRFYVCERSRMKVDLDESKGFFGEFYEWMEQPGTDAFLYNFFMDRNLTGFKPGSTTQTAALRRMVGLSVGDYKDALAQLVKLTPRFHNERLLQALKDAGCENVLAADIVRVMKGLGYKLARRKVSGCRTAQVDIWQPNVKRSPTLTPSEVAMIQADDHREAVRTGLVQFDAN